MRQSCYFWLSKKIRKAAHWGSTRVCVCVFFIGREMAVVWKARSFIDALASQKSAARPVSGLMWQVAKAIAKQPSGLNSHES